MIIYSGGQTGVDRAAWDAAKKNGLRQGGWVPKGRLAEDGRIPKRYLCRETDSPDYAFRTEKNLTEADATLILTFGPPSGGTLLTLQLCRKHRRPHLAIDLDREGTEAAVAFLNRHKPVKLNVAGPRASFRPDVHEKAFSFLSKLFDETGIKKE